MTFAHRAEVIVRKMINPASSSRELMGAQTSPATVDGIQDVARGLNKDLEDALDEINTINHAARLLSFNARVEASRAGGETGASFAVVAQAMGELSLQTERVAKSLGRQSRASIGDLERICTNYRGQRLSDLALNNIDLIDRNLYERSCDVRWWATDESVVAALTRPTRQASEHASRRLGVILDSYTVYFDLVLCDTSGKVVANGRPGQFKSVGSNQKDTPWFRTAMATRTGAEFGFQTVHKNGLVDNQRVLVYSCAVRTGGEATGKPIGVLGILFNWDALAQGIVENVPLEPAEWKRTRVCITDDTGFVLADSRGLQLADTLVIPNLTTLFSEKKGFQFIKTDSSRVCIAHARSVGFETYSTGWHSLLIYDD